MARNIFVRLLPLLWSLLLYLIFAVTSLYKMTTFLVSVLWNLFQIARYTLALVALIIDHFLKEIKEQKRNNSRKKRRFQRGRQAGRREGLKRIRNLPSIEGSPLPPYSPSISSDRRNNNFVMTNYCLGLVEDFQGLAEDLLPTKQFIKKGRKAASDVFELLKQRSGDYGIKISRTRIAGSVGKETGISYEDDENEIKNPDFDCVVYINDEKPPFDQVLRTWKKILDGYHFIDEIYYTSRSLQFIYKHETEGDIHFDLLPATNYVQLPINLNKTVGQEQAELAMKIVSQIQQKHVKAKRTIDTDVNKDYSSCFSENTVEFINNHVEDDFTRDVILLAKYWVSQLDFKNMYISGKSCMIELIAIHAQKKKKCGRTCIISGFKRFLEEVATFRNLVVCFNDRNTLPYQLEKNNNSCDGGQRRNRQVYNLLTLKRSGPIIIDPSNPYNNFAYDIKDQVVKIFEDQARETLTVLDELKRSEDHENVEDAIDEIFCHKVMTQKTHR